MAKKQKIEIDEMLEAQRVKYARPRVGGPVDRPSKVSVNGYQCKCEGETVEVDGVTMHAGCEQYSRDCGDCEHYAEP